MSNFSTYIHTCAHTCAHPSTCPAYTHLQTVLPIHKHTPTHTKLPCQKTQNHPVCTYIHMHAICLPSCTHTRRAYRSCDSVLCPSHTRGGGGVCLCTCTYVNLSRTTNPLGLGPSTPRAACPASASSPKRTEPPGLLGSLWRQGPGTSPGFQSPATAVERGVTAPSPASPGELRRA